MPMRPRSAEPCWRSATGNRARASAEGCLNEWTSHPCGLMPHDVLDRAVLPAASIAWNTSSTTRNPARRGCPAPSRAIPSLTREARRLLLSILRPSVSPASKSFSRKSLPFVIRNGSMYLRTWLTISGRGIALPSKRCKALMTRHLRLCGHSQPNVAEVQQGPPLTAKPLPTASPRVIYE